MQTHTHTYTQSRRKEKLKTRATDHRNKVLEKTVEDRIMGIGERAHSGKDIGKLKVKQS